MRYWAHAPRQEIQSHRQAEAPGGPHREELQAARGFEEDGALPRLGDGEQVHRRLAEAIERQAKIDAQDGEEEVRAGGPGGPRRNRCPDAHELERHRS